jgi:hypothetical protein
MNARYTRIAARVHSSETEFATDLLQHLEGVI